jgi:hypothetical protein
MRRLRCSPTPPRLSRRLVDVASSAGRKGKSGVNWPKPNKPVTRGNKELMGAKV